MALKLELFHTHNVKVWRLSQIKGQPKMKKSKEIVLSAASILFYTIASVAYSAVEPPSWFIETPNDENYYYGVGHSKENIEDAEAKARKELILSIAATIHAEVEQHSQSVDDGNSERTEGEFTARSRSYAKQESLPGVEIFRRYSGRTGNYALARLSREKYRQHMRQKHIEVQEIAKSGDKRLADGHIIAALREYSHALKFAKTLTPLNNETSNFISEVDIQQKIVAAQTDIQITAISGNEQTVDYGGSLPQPLVVEVYYQNQPLRECPLKATYIHGTGQLRNSRGEIGTSVSIYADEEGKGTCWVDAAKSISRENCIQVTVDVEGIQQLAPPAAVFHYDSAFSTRHKPGAPTITLNGSADEPTFAEGSKVDIEIRVPNRCHIHLFSIVANGDFGYLQSVPIEQAYVGNGWHVISTDSGWTLQMDCVPLRADYGRGIETLLVITTEKVWKPNGEEFTMDSLSRQLEESVGVDNWRVGWGSYYIEPKKEGIQ